MVQRRRSLAFTLVELLISVSVISIILSMVMPVLSHARTGARTVKCLGQLRQLGAAWQLYADDYRGYCMPQVWFKAKPPVYWWGANGDPADYEAGLVYPYIEMEAGLNNVFDCPEQPWGSYIPQGAARGPTKVFYFADHDDVIACLMSGNHSTLEPRDAAGNQD